MHTHRPQSTPLLKYTILFATLAFVLLASCTTNAQARMLGTRDVAAHLKKTIAEQNLRRHASVDHINGTSEQLLTNGERLARGLPLKKPQLPHSGESQSTRFLPVIIF